MWETNERYCDTHESFIDDEFPCECHLLYLEDRENDYMTDLWEERMR
jgi:hypothetical protein